MSLISFRMKSKFLPWRRKWQSTPALLPGKSHGQKSLVGYSPWRRKESDTIERLHFVQFSQHHLLKRLFFFFLYVLGSFVINYLTVYEQVYFWDLCSFLLIYRSDFMPRPYCLEKGLHFLMQFLKVIFHLQLPPNTSYIPCVVQYILKPLLSPQFVPPTTLPLY